MNSRESYAVLACSDPRIQGAIAAHLAVAYGLETGEYFPVRRGGLIPHAIAMGDCPAGIIWDVEVLQAKLEPDALIVLYDHTDCAGRDLLIRRDMLIRRPEHHDLLSVVERLTSVSRVHGLGWEVRGHVIQLHGSGVVNIVDLDEAATDEYVTAR